jgi:hypothetical protein
MGAWLGDSTKKETRVLLKMWKRDFSDDSVLLHVRPSYLRN